MIGTPLLVKAGDALSARFGDVAPAEETGSTDLERHVVVVGYDRVGKLVCFMLEKLGVSYVAFDSDLAAVEQGKRSGKNVHFGDMYSPVTHEAAGLERAVAAFVSSSEDEGMALPLSRLRPELAVFARVRTLREQRELISKGVQHADTGFIEGALVRGSALLQHMGVSQPQVDGLAEDLRRDSYALLHTAEAEFEPESA
jgi:voltage-gated potassium channel Kch